MRLGSDVRVPMKTYTKSVTGLRAEQKAKLDSDPSLTLGDVTTVNLTIMEGGIQTNVVPDKFKLTFDIRNRSLPRHHY